MSEYNFPTIDELRDHVDRVYHEIEARIILALRRKENYIQILEKYLPDNKEKFIQMLKDRGYRVEVGVCCNLGEDGPAPVMYTISW